MKRQKYSSKSIPKTRITRDVNRPTERTIIIPKNISLSKIKSEVKAYRSGISNLFTDSDVTLTERGYLRFFIDQGYSGDVQKSLTMYEQDDLINGLITSVVNLANTKMNFNLPKNNKKESKVWDTWAKRVNVNVKNTLPGIEMLNSGQILSLLQTGMATMDFKWGKLQVGRIEYDMPMQITIIPTLGTRLALNDDIFGDELIYVSINETFYKSKVQDATGDQEYTNLFMDFGEKRYGMLRKNAFAIKYRYTPNNTTLYPIPFLKPSFESIALRHKLLDADLSLLELVINKIIQIKVGDEKNQPIPATYDDAGNIITDGDIELAKELFEGMSEEVEVVATPYYYEIKIVIPDTTFLLDQKKYIQSSFNILSNFGIIIDPSSSSNSTKFDKMNFKNYEGNAVALQKHVAGWYTWLAMQIVAKNPDKLKTVPDISFNKPEIDGMEKLKFMKELFDSGVVDIYTLLDGSDISKDTVKERLLMQFEEELEHEKLYQPRATFKQEIVDKNGDKKTTSVSDDKLAKSKGGKQEMDDDNDED